MPSKTKTTILLLTLVIGMIYLVGCKKTSLSPEQQMMLGIWTLQSQKVVTIYNNTGVVAVDTTLNYSTSGITITLTADGRYINCMGTDTQFTETYTVSGKQFTTSFPTSPSSEVFVNNINRLDAHNFQYSYTESLYGPLGPASGYDTLILSR